MIPRRVVRLLRLDPHQRWLVFEALALLSAVSPLVKYGPARLTGRLIRRASTGGIRSTSPRVAGEVAAAVNQAALRVPSATCLARALTAWAMVTRRHEAATLRLGVQRDGAREFAAHAWLECNGERVIGGESAHEYSVFPTFS